MNLITQISIGGIAGLFIGFAVGYFVWLFIRWGEKRKAPKKIQEQNLKFKHFEHDNLNEVQYKNVKTQEVKQIESRVIQDTGTNRKGKSSRFGKAFN